MRNVWLVSDELEASMRVNGLYAINNGGDGIVLNGDNIQAKNVYSRNNKGAGIKASLGKRSVAANWVAEENSGGGIIISPYSAPQTRSVSLTKDDLFKIRGVIDSALSVEGNARRILDTEPFRRLQNSINIAGNLASLASFLAQLLLQR